MDFEYLKDIATTAAIAAGKVVQKSIDKDVIVHKKKGGNTYASQIVTEVDKASEKVILQHLVPTCKSYNLGLLTEESEDNKSRFEKEYFWCIDPLDGTLAFVNNYSGFSISIALVAKDGTPVIGVVYNPSTNDLYHGIKGKGAYKNNKVWNLKTPKKQLTYITDKSLSDTPNKKKIIEILNNKVSDLNLENYEEISGSGAVLNAILVVENAPAIMLKFPKKEQGGGSIWDYAATTCIYNELNLQATTFSGENFNFNRLESTFMNTEGIYFSSIKK